MTLIFYMQIQINSNTVVCCDIKLQLRESCTCNIPLPVYCIMCVFLFLEWILEIFMSIKYYNNNLLFLWENKSVQITHCILTIL